MAHYFIQSNGKVFGPLRGSRVKELCREGRIERSTPVRKDEGPWVPAGRIAALKDLFSEPAVSVPPSGKPIPKPSNPKVIVEAEPVIVVSQPTIEPPAPPSRPPRSVARETARRGFHGQRLTLLIISAVGGMGTFLPWVYAPIVGAVLGTMGDGWITLVLFGVVALISVIGTHSEMIAIWARILSMLLALAAAAIAGQKIWAFERLPRQHNDNEFAESLLRAVQTGPGVYLVIAAGIAVCGAALFWSPQRR